jgi:DNA-binding YbaB/EbfC family protein
MTDNPFGAMNSEGGGFDLQAMLEQAQQMQNQLVAAQQELAAASVEGSAGGVAVTLTGTGELTAVTITPGTFDGADAESLADLGDLVVAAYRDGKAQVDALASQALGPLAGGGMDDLGGGLPGGLGGGAGPGV